jgi:hypothetical protein
MKTNRQKFHELKGLPENACLDLQQIASLSGYSEDMLKLVYRRATAPKPGKPGDPFTEKKKKEKKAKPVEGFTIAPAGKGAGYTRVYAFVMGKYGKDKDIAITFGLLKPEEDFSPLHEETLDSEEELSAQCPDWFQDSDYSTLSESDSDSSSLGSLVLNE